MKHRWPDKSEWYVIASCDSPDGNEHHIRACLHCGIVKITVIPPRERAAWHEGITASGPAWIGEATPPCIPKGNVQEINEAGAVPNGDRAK